MVNTGNNLLSCCIHPDIRIRFLKKFKKRQKQMSYNDKNSQVCTE